jgi:hypothetical protein
MNNSGMFSALDLVAGVMVVLMILGPLFAVMSHSGVAH